MMFALRQGDVLVYRLPALVTEPVLTDLADRMAGSLSGPQAVVLDCTRVDHIHFRDFRRFATRMRRMGPVFRPIQLAGLNPYCEEIVRFALDAEDWDLFQTAAAGLAAPGGKGAAEMVPKAGASWGQGSGARVAVWSPCPN